MEIRQLECFVAAVEHKTFLNASKALHLTQPAVSKSILQLEKDLNKTLFVRSTTGLRLTSQGENLYQYAKDILRQVELMKKSTTIEEGNRLCVASYHSYNIASLLADYYVQNPNMERLDFREGGLQEIIDWIFTGVSEIGIVYVSTKRKDEFEHIFEHKNLEFIPLSKGHISVYLGDKHHLSNEPNTSTVSIKQLNESKFIRGLYDFFTVVHHSETVNLTPTRLSGLNYVVTTNSDHLAIQIMSKTDLCYIAADATQTQTPLKYRINTGHNEIMYGYLKRKNTPLSLQAQSFINNLTQNTQNLY